ncbi:unnamed protein product [Blepharisma stoltei]|uniref:CBM20 domain-containing protein n=1 Tax=Blepharisma stoltei TaxID=1481888 RepID=A0AAU9IUL0_9CILI|nr:unnamed protein product [Blepharisma stoltei]
MESQNQNSFASLNNHNHAEPTDEEEKYSNGISHNHTMHSNGFHEHPESAPREELKVSIPSRAQPKPPKSSKSKKFDISDLKKDPEMYQKILDEAIRIEKNNNKSSIYELDFQIQYPTAFGEKILITGSSEILGNWDVSSALELEWSPGNIWKISLPIPEGQLSDFEYKYVCVKGADAVWEGGSNRVLKLSDGKPKGESLIFNRHDAWQK